jgi:hypothetical protein
MPKHQHLMKRPSHILIDTRYCPRHLACFSLLDFSRHHIKKRVEGRSPQIWGGWSLSGRIGVWSAVGALVAMRVGGKDSVGYLLEKEVEISTPNGIETQLNEDVRSDFCARPRNRGATQKASGYGTAFLKFYLTQIQTKQTHSMQLFRPPFSLLQPRSLTLHTPLPRRPTQRTFFEEQQLICPCCNVHLQHVIECGSAVFIVAGIAGFLTRQSSMSFLFLSSCSRHSSSWATNGHCRTPRVVRRRR